jgi:hypothetical protein
MNGIAPGAGKVAGLFRKEQKHNGRHEAAFSFQ